MKRRNFLLATIAGIFSGKVFAQTNSNPPTNIETNPILNVEAVQNTSKKKSGKNNPLRGTSADPRRLPPISAPNVPTQWNTYNVKITANPSKKLSSIWLPLPMIQNVQNNLYQKLLKIETNGNFYSQNTFHNYENNYHILSANYSENSISSRNSSNNSDNENYYSNSNNSNSIYTNSYSSTSSNNSNSNSGTNKNKSGAILNVNLTIQTADRHTDFSKRNVAPERVDILKYYLENSQLIPNDKTSKALASKIINRIKDPIAQARAIFDWIVENSTYDLDNFSANNSMNLRGNVRKQLENQSPSKYNFRGRSAELNGLFVSLCRSIGIPARCVCGQRIAKSKLLPCLGIENNIATDFQHIRAEFYSPGCGWIPIDVSDVKRAEFFKTSELELKMLQTLLFGFWEMNWFAFGFGSEVILNNTNNNISSNISSNISNSKISFFDKALAEEITTAKNSQFTSLDSKEIIIETS